MDGVRRKPRRASRARRLAAHRENQFPVGRLDTKSDATDGVCSTTRSRSNQYPANPLPCMDDTGDVPSPRSSSLSSRWRRRHAFPRIHPRPVYPPRSSYSNAPPPPPPTTRRYPRPRHANRTVRPHLGRRRKPRRIRGSVGEGACEPMNDVDASPRRSRFRDPLERRSTRS